MSVAVRFGLIGLGRWGQVHLRTLLALGDRCRLTHLGTRHPDHAALVPYPVRVMADWRALIEADCDAVIIAAPPHVHAEMVEACVSAGKPCIVEKPLCLDVATAERVHARVTQAGALVLVDHTQLFHPAYQALKRSLREAGEPVRIVLAERMGSEYPKPDVPVLWDWGPHDVSLSLDLLGQDPVEIGALGGPPGASGDPELVSLRLDFASGACAWIHAGRLASQKRRVLGVLTDTRVYVFDDLAAEKLVVSSRRAMAGTPNSLPVWPQRRPWPLPSDESSMTVMLTYFLDGLAGGERGCFGTGLALRVTRVLGTCESLLRRLEVTGQKSFDRSTRHVR